MSTIWATTRRRLVFTVSLSIVCAPSLFSQSKTLTRTFEPIVVRAEKIAPLLNEPINVFTAYSYNAAIDSFTAIPFQIDDVTASGNFFQETDGIIDSTDQLVFMPGDAGDQATTSQWVNDPGVATKRIELELTDTGIAGGKGWVYLFRNVATPPVVKSYVNYDRGASTTAFSDTITGLSYIEAHDATGWYTDSQIPSSVGGNGQDIFDRRKILIIVKITISPIFPPIIIPVKEDTLQYVAMRFLEGPVRGVRELIGSIQFAGNTVNVPFVTEYFPYSNVFSVHLEIPTTSNVTINEIRQSLDLNSNAVGMKFYNPSNPNGISIDGAADPQISTTVSSGLNWMMAAGTPGTVLTLVTVPQLGDERKLYYKDNAITPDVNDTGDGLSYGDNGWQILSSTNISGKLDFDLATYFLKGDTSLTIGDDFVARALNAVEVSAQSQDRTSTSVTERGGLPSSFVLDDAQPNPLWQLRGSVRLSFSLPQNITSPRLRIYNVIGQEVARFDFKGVQATGSKYQVQWDGRAANGQMLPAGIYFYQLQAGTQVATKKLVIIR